MNESALDCAVLEADTKLLTLCGYHNTLCTSISKVVGTAHIAYHMQSIRLMKCLDVSTYKSSISCKRATCS